MIQVRPLYGRGSVCVCVHVVQQEQSPVVDRSWLSLFLGSKGDSMRTKNYSSSTVSEFSKSCDHFFFFVFLLSFLFFFFFLHCAACVCCVCFGAYECLGCLSYLYDLQIRVCVVCFLCESQCLEFRSR